MSAVPDGCTEAIMKHFNLEHRFELMQSIPYFKGLPLHLDSVVFGENQVEINGTTHKFGVYRKYREGIQVPKDHEDENRRGGSSKDLAPNGVMVRNTMLLPGDVELTPKMNWVEGYDGKDATASPDFQLLLQYTVKKGNEEKIQRFSYTKKLHEAFKYLTTKLFGGYFFSIQVKNLTLKWGLSVIPLPVGVSFTPENLILGSSSFLKSFPLRNMLNKNRKIHVLDVEFGLGNASFHYDFTLFEKCHTALLRDLLGEVERPVEKILKLKNPNIIVVDPARSFISPFVKIIQNRMQNCPPEHHKFTLVCPNEQFTNVTLDKLEAEFKHRVTIDSPMILEINNQEHLQLEVALTIGEGWRQQSQLTIEVKRKSRKRPISFD